MKEKHNLNERTNERTNEREYVGIKVANKRGFIECEIGGVADFLYPTSNSRRGRVQGNGQISPTITAEEMGICKVEKNLEYEIKDGVCYTSENVTKGNEVDWNNTEYRIRKLTPRECLRLMDVADEDIEKMAAVNSQTQLYKTAGNSIVVAMLCAVYSQLNIQGIKPWNERTIEDKRMLTAYGLKKEPQF